MNQRDIDEQDRAEHLDEDELAGDFPPERPLGVEDYGTTPQEERVPEPLYERVKREEPDFGERGAAGRAVDPERRMVLDTENLDAPLAEDDRISGDETAREFATEREAPPPAEEAALHIIGEP